MRLRLGGQLGVAGRTDLGLEPSRDGGAQRPGLIARAPRPSTIQRHAAVGDPRGLRQTEQFLQLHRQYRRCGCVVVVEQVVDPLPGQHRALFMLALHRMLGAGMEGLLLASSQVGDAFGEGMVSHGGSG